MTDTESFDVGASPVKTWADKHTSIAVQRRLKPSARFITGNVLAGTDIKILSGDVQSVGAPNEIRILGPVVEGDLIAVLGPRGYTFTKSGDVAGNFEITNGNELRAAQDVESSVVSVIVAAVNSQGEAGSTRTVTIYVDPHAPTNIALSATTVASDAATSTKIADITTTDADVGDTFTYTCSNANNLFKIANDDELQVNASLVAYDGTSQTVSVTSTDASGLSYTKDFTITIT
jgi:hypothetical protein